MIEEIRVETIETIVFITRDNKEFTSKHSALLHEWRLQATKVFMVYNRGANYSLEVYSTRRLAEKAAVTVIPSSLIIKEIYLNEREETADF